MRARDWKIGDVWTPTQSEIVAIERGRALVWTPGRNETPCRDAVIVTWRSVDPSRPLCGTGTGPRGERRMAYHPNHDSRGGLVRQSTRERAA